MTGYTVLVCVLFYSSELSTSLYDELILQDGEALNQMDFGADIVGKLMESSSAFVVLFFLVIACIRIHSESPTVDIINS